MDDSSVLEVPAREVGYCGETLKVSPLQIRQIPPFAREIRPIFAAFANAFTFSASGDGSGGGGELLMDGEELVALAGEHGERLIAAVAIATGADRDLIERGNAAEFIELVIAVVEVNADFFARAVTKAAAVVGRKPSNT